MFGVRHRLRLPLMTTRLRKSNIVSPLRLPCLCAAVSWRGAVRGETCHKISRRAVGLGVVAGNHHRLSSHTSAFVGAHAVTRSAPVGSHALPTDADARP